PSGSDVLLVDRNGTILARYPDHEEWVGKPAPQGTVIQALLRENEGSAEAPGVDWVVRVHGFTTLGHMLPEQQISLSVGIPRSVLLAAANRSLVRNLALLALTVLAFTGMVIVLGELFLHEPIGALIRASQKLAAGDRKARTGLDHRRDEFGKLGRAFDNMAKTLQDRDRQQKTVEAELRESEELHREIASIAEVGVARFDLQGRRTFVNDTLVRRAGMSREQLLKGRVGDLQEGEDREKTLQAFQKCVSVGSPVQGIVTRTLVGGHAIYTRAAFAPLSDSAGKLIDVQSTSVDISDVMEAQERLRESDAFHRGVVALADVAVARFDVEGRRVFVDEALARRIGGPVEELKKGVAFDHCPPEDREELWRLFRQCVETGKTFTGIMTRVPLDGNMLHLRANLAPVFAQAGKVSGAEMTSVDVTELVEAQEALRHSAELYRSLVECIGSVVVRANKEGRRTFVGGHSTEIMGKGAEKLLSGQFGDTMVTADRERAWALLQETFKTGRPVHDYVTRQIILGEERYISAHWVPIRDAQGNVMEVQTNSVDITEMIRAQEALRHSAELYRSLVECIGGWVIRVDREGRRTFFSGSTARFLSRTADELRAGRFGDTMAPEDAERARALLRETFSLGNPVHNFLTRQQVRGETRYIMSNWEPIKDAEGTVVEVQTTSIDVTDQVRLQQQFAQAQKMESVGRLAGGVAHDFNNLLTAILGYSEMALGTLPERSPARDYLREVQDAGHRAANLTRQLLAFSRRQVIEPRTVNPNELVEDLQKMLRQLIGEDIEVATRPASNAGSVRADPGQLEQVLINLAVNSRDAMPRGGKLTIETANVALDEEYARTHEEVSAGEYVLISVADTGVGMSDEVKAHLFEPFFTTKAQGQGTGLGLATCYGIVKQAGGHIEVESELGRGTTMKVFLPRIQDAAKEKPGEAEEAQPLGGAETVLVVEDEAAVRNLTTRSLRARGYTVLAAANGVEALRVAQEYSGRIHLLFTDVVMPELDGKQLSERLKALHPETRVLFTSGYTDEAISHRGVLEPGVAFLQKPFASAALLRKIRDVLDQPPSDTKED
ncbi:MAG: PAS domain S-box protein, partial [Chloroflexota bacterium]